MNKVEKPALRTAAEAREWLNARGISQVQFARENGVNVRLLHKVLHGKSKCLRGESHRIAVLLGMKPRIGIEA